MQHIILANAGSTDIDEFNRTASPEDEILVGRNTNAPLNSKGMQEAMGYGKMLNLARSGMILSEELLPLAIDRICTSTNIVALQTAELMGKELIKNGQIKTPSMQIEEWENLQERDLGLVTGMRGQEACNRYVSPQDYRNLTYRKVPTNWPGSETRQEYCARIAEFLSTLPYNPHMGKSDRDHASCTLIVLQRNTNRLLRKIIFPDAMRGGNVQTAQVGNARLFFLSSYSRHANFSDVNGVQANFHEVDFSTDGQTILSWNQLLKRGFLIEDL